LFEITMVCDPCERMDQLRAGLRSLLEDRRGMLAHVVDGGEVSLGDEVVLVAAPEEAAA
jgi:MOSC domain-containing protein YiiM